MWTSIQIKKNYPNGKPKGKQVKKQEQNAEHPRAVRKYQITSQKGGVRMKKGRGCIWRIIAENFPKSVKTTKQRYRNLREIKTG